MLIYILRFTKANQDLKKKRNRSLSAERRVKSEQKDVTDKETNKIRRR